MRCRGVVAGSLIDRRSEALSLVDGPHAPGNHQTPQISWWTLTMSSEQDDGLVAPRVHQRPIGERERKEGGPVSGRSWWGGGLLDQGDDDEVWARSLASVTRLELRSRVDEFAKEFDARGIIQGSSVGLRMPPSFTLLQALLALWSCGAQVVLTDVRLKPAEVAQLTEICQPQFSVHAGEPGQVVQGFLPECDFQVRELGAGRRARENTCLVQFSSGSTGRPKVIGRSAWSLLDELDRYAALPEMPAKGEQVLLLNSVIHTMGLIGGVLHGLNAGTTLVLPAKMRPSDILRTAAETGAESIFGVPMHFDLLGQVSVPPPLPQLRLAVSAGEVLRPEVSRRFRDRYGIPISQVYGMTEVGIIASDLPARYPSSTVGTSAPGIEIKQADGELLVRLDRSPYLTAEGTERYVDGWLRTFDRCTLDEDTGVLCITGRADSTVVIGGMNVDLAEVETVLREHEQVIEAVVVFGTVIEAHVGVTGSLTAAELIAWCRKRLSDHKIPKVVYPAPSVPSNAMGKLLRSRELLHATRNQQQEVSMRDEVRSFVLTTISKMCNTELDVVDDDTPLAAEGLGLESLFLLQLAAQLEQRYGVAFANDLGEMPRFTLGELVDDVIERLPVVAEKKERP